MDWDSNIPTIIVTQKKDGTTTKINCTKEKVLFLINKPNINTFGLKCLWQICVCVCVCVCVCTQSLSHIWVFATPWTVASQAPLSMGFSRQKYWSRLPFPPPGDLPNPEVKPRSPASPALAGGLFTTGPPANSSKSIYEIKFHKTIHQKKKKKVM